MASVARCRIVVFLVVVCVARLAYAQAPLPTTVEFDGMLRSCATGANIDLKADLVGSIRTIYDGQRTQGLASFQTSSEFLKLIPESQRLEAYKLYTQCIKDILTKR